MEGRWEIDPQGLDGKIRPDRFIKEYVLCSH